MKKIIVFVLLIFVDLSLWAELRTFCDMCKKEFNPNAEFSITIKINDKTQEMNSDLCDKCFEKLIKDLEKYNLILKTLGWKFFESIKTKSISHLKPFQYKYINGEWQMEISQ